MSSADLLYPSLASSDGKAENSHLLSIEVFGVQDQRDVLESHEGFSILLQVRPASEDDILAHCHLVDCHLASVWPSHSGGDGRCVVVVTAGHNHVLSFVSHWGVSPLPHLGSGGRVVVGIVVVSVVGASGTIVVVSTIGIVAALVGTGRVVSVFWLHDTNMEASTADTASVAIKVFLIVYLFVDGLKQGDYIQRLRNIYFDRHKPYSYSRKSLAATQVSLSTGG